MRPLDEMYGRSAPPSLGLTLVLPPRRPGRFHDRLQARKDRRKRDGGERETNDTAFGEGSLMAREGARRARAGGRPGQDRSPGGKGKTRDMVNEKPQGMVGAGNGWE